MTWTMVQSKPHSSTQANAFGEEQLHRQVQALLAQVGELGPTTSLRTMQLNGNLTWIHSSLSFTSSAQRVWVLQVSHFYPPKRKREGAEQLLPISLWALMQSTRSVMRSTSRTHSSTDCWIKQDSLADSRKGDSFLDQFVERPNAYCHSSDLLWKDYSGINPTQTILCVC